MSKRTHRDAVTIRKMSRSIAIILYLCLIQKLCMIAAMQRPHKASNPATRNLCQGIGKLTFPPNVSHQTFTIQRSVQARPKCSFQAIPPSPTSRTRLSKSDTPICSSISHAIYHQRQQQQPHHHRHKDRQTASRLSMALLPIPRESLSQIITTNLPTPAQYATYWGRTSREQYAFLFESFGVSFLGVFVCYFLSFAVGQFVATILGMVAAFWVLLGPELKAWQRNWELTGGRDLVDPWNDDGDVEPEDKRGLYGACKCLY